MTPDKSDALALDLLALAYAGGSPRLTQSQRDRLRQVTVEAKAENYESPGKRRSRFWGLGPSWGRFVKSRGGE